MKELSQTGLASREKPPPWTSTPSVQARSERRYPAGRAPEGNFLTNAIEDHLLLLAAVFEDPAVPLFPQPPVHEVSELYCYAGVELEEIGRQCIATSLLR